MKVKQVIRRDERTFKEKIHKNANLTLLTDIAKLSGPKFGFIADGIVKEVHTGYEQANYQIALVVLVGTVQTYNYHTETWFVTF